MPTQNRQWRVAQYPGQHEVITPALFDWVTTAIPQPKDGEFLVRSLYLGTGPAQRGYLVPKKNDFFATVPIGDVMRGRGVGEIVASNHPDYEVGRIFVGSLGWQDYSIQIPRGKEFVFSTKLLQPPVTKPLSLHLGILGQAGATAYFGLLDVGQLKTGDAVLVSAAAGGVGSVAGQIARLHGADRVVGITGSDDKCRWLIDELGLTAAINYRREDIDARLGELFPQGIDVFFDNVGGEILDIALGHLAERARIVICGFIATDYLDNPGPGPINYRQLVAKRAGMHGFVVFDYWDQFARAEADLHRWYAAGDLLACEDVEQGLENMPSALAALFSGDNCGIKLCRVGTDGD